MNLFSRLVPLGLATIATACVTSGPADPPDDDFGAQSTPLSQQATQLATQLSADLQEAQISLPGVERIGLTDDDRANFLGGQLGASTADVIGALGQASAPSEATLETQKIDSLGFTHQRYSQTIDGLPLVGGDIRITRNPAGEIIVASGVATRPTDIATATVDVDLAREEAFADTVGANEIEDGTLVYVAGSNLSPTLAWQFVVRGFNQAESLIVDDLVFVDAVNGNVVSRHPRFHTVRNRETRDADNMPDLGVIVRTEAQGPTGDPDVDAAHDAAGDTYDCLNDLLARDSYDDAGAMLTSITYFRQDAAEPYRNAGWSSQLKTMIYGQGFAEADVGTHEFGHALTNFTANLIYMNESGALNEGASDVLMAICDIHKAGAIDAGTWQVGEDLNVPGIPSPLREMDDPVSDGISADHYATRYMGNQDNGGVHWNSGIYNLYFVLLVEGGRHPRRTGEQQVVGAGIEVAQEIHFRALTMYLNQSSNFVAARMASEQAATDLYGEGSDEFISVQEAFNAVGVGGAPMIRPVCGNAEIERDEACDDGNTADGDGCNASCVAEICGDSVVNNNGTETCDDGNTVDGDGCDALCVIEEEGGCFCSSDPSAPVGAGWLLLLGAIGFGTRRRKQRRKK